MGERFRLLGIPEIASMCNVEGLSLIWLILRTSLPQRSERYLASISLTDIANSKSFRGGASARLLAIFDWAPCFINTGNGDTVQAAL